MTVELDTGAEISAYHALARAVLERALRDLVWPSIGMGDQFTAQLFLADGNPSLLFWTDAAQLDAHELLRGLHRLHRLRL